MECYCLDENHASRTLSSRFIGFQNPYQLQNLKILLTFQWHKNTGTKFLEFEFFSSEKTRLQRYYQNKNQLLVTSSSYINLAIKLKQDKSEIYFFGKQYLTFASDRFFIFSGLIVFQGMMQVNLKSEFNLFWKINSGSLKLPKT